MKKVLLAGSALLLLTAAFVASPIFTAWKIREAMASGNAAYLEAKLEWPTIRATLRHSLTDYALGPAPVAASGAAAPKPGFWQRIKANLSRRAVDNMIESYVTPEGLPKLFGVRQFYRENVSGEQARLDAMPWHERAVGFWSRIKRAEFRSPTVFEIEMADRNDPTRHYVGLMKLRGFEWKLVELRLKPIRDAQSPLPALTRQG